LLKQDHGVFIRKAIRARELVGGRAMLAFGANMLLLVILMESCANLNGSTQILQTSTNLALTNAWMNIQTNPAPAGTNHWLVPHPGNPQWFPVLERP
jgi:hypothetical protein